MMEIIKWFSALLLLVGLAACRPQSAGESPTGKDDLLHEMVDTSDKPQERRPGFTDDYTSTNRGIWQKPELIIDLLGTLDNKTVADIGAGTGFFSFRIAPKAKKVIAIDIDPRFVEYLDSARVRELPPSIQNRIEPRLAAPDNPNLAPKEADIVLIVNTYMYIKNRVAYLKNLKTGLTDGGTLIIVDFKKKRTPLGPPAELRIPLFQTEEELYEAGYRNIQTNDTALDYQYIVIAQK